MVGGAGHDTYTVDNVGDVVNEGANAGTDQVNASVTYTLKNNVEKLTLTGSGNLNGYGADDANTLSGNAGHNLLDGGLGNDTLLGNAGDDSMVGGSGSTLANTLTGNSLANTLDGGTGNDTYVMGRGSNADTLRDSDATAGKPRHPELHRRHRHRPALVPRPRQRPGGLHHRHRRQGHRQGLVPRQPEPSGAVPHRRRQDPARLGGGQPRQRHGRLRAPGRRADHLAGHLPVQPLLRHLSQLAVKIV